MLQKLSRHSRRFHSRWTAFTPFNVLHRPLTHSAIWQQTRQCGFDVAVLEKLAVLLLPDELLILFDRQRRPSSGDGTDDSRSLRLSLISLLIRPHVLTLWDNRTTFDCDAPEVATSGIVSLQLYSSIGPARSQDASRVTICALFFWKAEVAEALSQRFLMFHG